MDRNMAKPGGYSIEFVEHIDTRLKCPICKLVLRCPYQTECGHRYCEDCIKDVIESGDKKCPEDNTELALQHIFRDPFCNREILDLRCYCTRKKLGCDWTGQLKVLKEHDKDCLFVEVTCPNEGCDEKMLKKIGQVHMKETCKFKKIPCEFCGEEQWQPLKKEHHNTTCNKFRLECEKGCGAKVPRGEMKRHLTRDCPETEATCPLVGQCVFKGSRANLKKHLSEKHYEHTVMVTDKIALVENNIQEIQNTTVTIQHKQKTLANQANDRREEIARVSDEIATLRGAVDRQVERFNEVEERARAMPAREPQGAERPDEVNEQGNNVEEINDIKNRLDKLEDLVKQIQLRSLNVRPQIAGQTGEGDNANFRELQELQRRVSTMERQMTLSDVQMTDHDVEFNVLQTSSHDGTFVWKIDDFGRRYQEAVTGRVLSIYSPQFYISGYKVCARVYLNGDGMGKGSHLSLFFVIMRGVYDELLPWPFQQKVSFKLIDQGGDQHIIDSFRPDPNSSSLQRPTSNMNIASGCPLFVRMSMLSRRGYIRDDAIKLEINVDTTATSVAAMAL